MSQIHQSCADGNKKTLDKQSALNEVLIFGVSSLLTLHSLSFYHVMSQTLFVLSRFSIALTYLQQSKCAL